MGKPIPSQETPEYVAAAAKESKAAVPPSAKILKTTTATGTKRIFGTPRISFVGKFLCCGLGIYVSFASLA